MWMIHVQRVCVNGCALGAFLFMLAFNLYVSQSALSYGYQMAVWVVSCFLVTLCLVVMVILVILAFGEKFENYMAVYDFLGGQ